MFRGSPYRTTPTRSPVRQMGTPRSSPGRDRLMDSGASKGHSFYGPASTNQFNNLEPGTKSPRIQNSPRRQTIQVPSVSSSAYSAPCVTSIFPSNIMDFHQSGPLGIALGQDFWLFDTKRDNTCLFQAQSEITAVKWLTNSSVVVAADNYSPNDMPQIGIYDINRKDIVRQLIGHNPRCSTIAVSGNTIITGGEDGQVMVYDIRSHSPQCNQFNVGPVQITRIECSPSGNSFGFGTYSPYTNGTNSVGIVDPGSNLRQYPMSGPIISVAWINEQILAAGERTGDGPLHLISESGQMKHVMTGSAISGLAFNSQSGLLISHEDMEGTWEIYDPFNNQTLATNHGSGPIIQFALSPQADTLASIGDSPSLGPQLTIWDLMYPITPQPPSPFFSSMAPKSPSTYRSPGAFRSPGPSASPMRGDRMTPSSSMNKYPCIR